MNVKAKFIGKIPFTSKGIEFVKGITYTIDKAVVDTFPALFEVETTKESKPKRRAASADKE